MKKVLFSILAICIPMLASAQETSENVKTHDVYLEIGGASSGIGVTYDSRFSNRTRWGWRAGIGFGYSNSSGYFVGNESTRAWSVPVGVNYLIGNHKNSLELGVGVSLGLYNGHHNEYEIKQVDKATYDAETEHPSPNVSGAFEVSEGQYALMYGPYKKSTNDFGYFFFGDIGYRHVANSGFVFRVGLSPSWNFADKHAVSRSFDDEFQDFSLGGYIAFGWVF